MIDFAQARRTMVDTQLRTIDVTDQALLDAVLDVPREVFVPAERRALAYLDTDVPVPSSKRSLIQPMVLIRLIQAAAITASDSVLDVGSATGYASAVMAHLAAKVVALESDAALASMAELALSTATTGAVQSVEGPLDRGWAPLAPYDVILLEGAVEFIPDALTAQLAEGGRLVAVMGRGRAGRASVHVKQNGTISERAVFDAAAPALPGFSRTAQFTF